MANYNINGWLDAALSHVRLKPARKSIRAELFAHMEDKEQELLERGKTPSEAMRLTVTAMGDPEEVGKALDEVHRPFWGVLYAAAKVLLVAAIAAVLFVMLDGRISGALGKYPLKAVEFSDINMEGTKAQTVYPQKAELDGYTYMIEQGVFCEEALGQNWLIVDLKVTNPTPWAKPPLAAGLLRAKAGEEDLADVIEVCILDSKGNTVSGDIFREDILDEHRIWGSWYFRFYITVPERAEKVELYYSLNDELSFTFFRGEAQR